MRILLRLAGLTVPVLLVACSSGSSAPDIGGAGGTTIRSIEGNPSGSAPLRPEPGNIWSDGLTPSAPSR
ncbi:hypothetical protein QMO56_25785 [Roseomonas sp. E05]|uniref:hypothetical protein n=1 Tax=Roseomonas sp. E05 TaxID=3046310 RepID=UPI0024B91EA2|nr:hypothetical protein [Roseomonas sp. E05]MDJ0391519.1 hypothetical protein [Roseomonas sp. E05]